MSDSDGQVVALLREIRDLQRQHFERYVEFTNRVIEQQRRSADRAQEDTAAALAEQRRVGRALRRQEILAPIFALILAGSVIALALLAFAR